MSYLHASLKTRTALDIKSKNGNEPKSLLPLGPTDSALGKSMVILAPIGKRRAFVFMSCRSLPIQKILNAALLALCAALIALAASHAGAQPQAVKTIWLNPPEAAQIQRLASLALLKPPAPMAVVHTEGQLPGSAGYQAAVKAKPDWPALLALASAYSLAGAAAHPADVDPVEQLRAGYERYQSRWLDSYRISGNPVDETGLGQWLLAFRMAGSALSEPVQQRMRSFACELSERYQQPLPRGKGTSSNNWQSHRVKLAVMGALVCANARVISTAQRLFAEQIQQNLLPSGESIDFKQRDALHYVVYSLEPLLEAALFASFHDLPLFDTTAPQGQSLARALEWLLPYVNGQLSHEEFVQSSVAFDKARADAGVAGFTGPFNPEKARHLYWLAAQLDAPRWAATSQALGAGSALARAGWLAR